MQNVDEILAMNKKLACKKEIKFTLFRRVIFECCSMIQDIEKEIV